MDIIKSVSLILIIIGVWSGSLLFEADSVFEFEKGEGRGKMVSSSSSSCLWLNRIEPHNKAKSYPIYDTSNCNLGIDCWNLGTII